MDGKPVRVITNAKLLYLSLDLHPGPYGSVPQAEWGVRIVDDPPQADDLAAFISARLSEDEAMAQRNVGDTGLHDDGDPAHGPGYPDYQTYSDADTDAADEYIRHFRPARVLREVTAKRAILAWWQRSDPDPDGPSPSPTYENYRKSLPGYQLILELAAIWSDHPDYRPEWAPGHG